MPSLNLCSELSDASFASMPGTKAEELYTQYGDERKVRTIMKRNLKDALVADQLRAKRRGANGFGH
jgi:hypothetical protein